MKSAAYLTALRPWLTYALLFSLGLSTAAHGALEVGITSLQFAPQSMGTTSPPQTISVKNTGATVVSAISIQNSDAQFAYSHGCVDIQVGGSCSIDVTFIPEARPGVLHSTFEVFATLTVSDGSPSPVTISLAGVGEKSLITHYYRSILRRSPDESGKAFWASEASRLAGLGANVNEVWYAMATYFFFSPEYIALNRDAAGFVDDLYAAFFNRAPDASGHSFWVDQIQSGMPREVVLVSFMFSAEFKAFAEGIFGNTTVRPEIDTVIDFYRGLLARLPETAGFESWLQAFQLAQCRGDSEVVAQVESISKGFTLYGEYPQRARTNSQYIGDLYNTFLRRGGELSGVNHWIGQLTGGHMTREQVRQAFIASPEFQARVNSIIAAGCLTQGTTSTVGAGFGAPAMAVGSDGLPVIAAMDGQQAIVVYKCSDPECALEVAASNLPAGGSITQHPQIALGSDLRPYIVYAYSTNSDNEFLVLVKCGDTRCSPDNNNTITIAQKQGNHSISKPAIGIDVTDGLPFVAYGNFVYPEYGLNVLKCGDSSCATGNVLTTVDVGGQAYKMSAVSLPDSVAFAFDGNKGLKVLKCANRSCATGGITTTIDPNFVVSEDISFRVGPDGLGIVAYGTHDGSIHSLNVAKCLDIACSTSQITKVATTVYDGSGTVDRVSMAIGADGLPVIVFTKAHTINVVKCGNSTCSTSNTVTTLKAISAYFNGVAVSATDLRPLVMYSNPDPITLLRCNTLACN